MDNRRLCIATLVYVVLIPATWILSVAVTGGVYGYIGGQRIAKAYSDTQLGIEVSAFMKKHGFSTSMTKEEANRQIERLSPQDKAEFQRILYNAVKTDDIMRFGSIFSVCVIVFGIIGFLSGILTKVWIPAGIFPLIALLIDPIRRFIVLGYMSTSQKITTVLIAQFAVCYVFAYFGALLANRCSKNRNAIPINHSESTHS